jgi:hypothetical protein
MKTMMRDRLSGSMITIAKAGRRCGGDAAVL